MTKNRSLAAMLVVAVAVVLFAGGLMASNMGFKLNKTLLAGSDDDSASGLQFLALPYNRQVGIDTAQELFEDIGNVQEVNFFNTETNGYITYALGEDDYDLVQGAGYQIKMDANVNYIVVGSHDPSATIQLQAGGAGSASGIQLFAPPYHATSSTARELFEELGVDNVQEINRFNTSSNGFTTYALGEDDYDLAPGEAYQIKMEETLAFSPSHY